MRTTGIRPEGWKCDFLLASLLKKKPVILVKQKDGECSVKSALIGLRLYNMT